MRVFIPKGASHYYVFFRHSGGKQVNRSCGTAVYSDAVVRAREIFVETLTARKTQTELSTLERIEATLKAMQAGGASAPKSTQEKHDLFVAHEAFLKSRKGEVSDFQLRDLRNRGRHFVEWARKQAVIYVEDVTPELVHRWIESCDLAESKSYNNYLGLLSPFFSWCRETPQTYISDNPVSKVPRKRVHRKEIKALEGSQCQQLFDYLEANKPEFCCYYGLATFAGMRLDTGDGELVRLSKQVEESGWGSVIRGNELCVAKPKVGAPRWVPLSDQMRAWLSAYPTLTIPSKNQHQYLREKFALPGNGNRHTAISLFVSGGGSFAKAAKYFGTSETIIKARYYALLSPEQEATLRQVLPKKKAARAA